jgi:diadenosine tetraphosphate (Ap4A) HIT family hydrolase
MDKCLGCEIVTGRIATPGGVIYEDDYWMLTHSISSQLPPLKGMLILQPKRHCEHLAELTSEEIDNLGFLLRDTTKAITEILHPSKIYAVSAGEGIKHVHFMIIPRMEGMTIGADLLKEVIEDHLWTCSLQEASDVVIKIRDHLRSRQEHSD